MLDLNVWFVLGGFFNEEDTHVSYIVLRFILGEKSKLIICVRYFIR